jgi:hypothetical protein
VPRRDVGASTSTYMVNYVATTAPSSTIGSVHNLEHSSPHSAVPNDVFVVPVNSDISANSFRFSLHNLTDEIPQGRLPQGVSPMLEEVSEVEHDEVHSH